DCAAGGVGKGGTRIQRFKKLSGEIHNPLRQAAEFLGRKIEGSHGNVNCTQAAATASRSTPDYHEVDFVGDPAAGVVFSMLRTMSSLAWPSWPPGTKTSLRPGS